MKVLVIPDKFKGTLTAREAGEAIARGWLSVRVDDSVEVLPMSDGGDGFGEIIGGLMGMTERKVETVDSAGRRRVASYWANGEEAVIETAQVNGLALLPPGKFHPFDLDTFGLGKVFAAATAAGAKRLLVGIGGSATNDGGFGMARALGWHFHDERGWEMTRWTDLDCVMHAIPPAEPSPFEVTTAVDVQNPLLGQNGASWIYGPQKGLRVEDMSKAEECLGALATIMKARSGVDFAAEPGTGAAGGLGFGLRAFLNAKFVPGSEIFATAARLDERLKEADLVISGEGAIDVQSLMGKGVGELFERCRRAEVKRIGLAGSLGPGVIEQFSRDPDLLLMGMVPELAPLEQAKAEPKRWLGLLAAKAAEKFNGESLRA